MFETGSEIKCSTVYQGHTATNLEVEINGMHQTEASSLSLSPFASPTFSQPTVLTANAAGGFHCWDDHRRESPLKDRRPEAGRFVASATSVATALQLFKSWRAESLIQRVSGVATF